MRKPRTIRIRNAAYETRIIGAAPTPLRDLYHLVLLATWPSTLGLIAGVFVGVNALFGLAFLWVGGVAHATAGSFGDAFFFSVQTMGTIGYGAMFPESLGAHLLVTAESLVGLALTAMATGLVFAKFSRSTARLVFAQNAVIGPMDGAPTLMVRLGNQRGNRIVDCHVRMTMVRTERSPDGTSFYRMIDLTLVRERIPSLARSWTVMHRIAPDSPLHGLDGELLARDEVEIALSLIGLDETTMQAVHGDYRYFPPQIRWNTRYADVLSEGPDGALVVDLRRFHDVEPLEPLATADP